MRSLGIIKKDSGIHLAHLEDVNKCYIGTSSYGELTSASFNKTEVKKIIKWLQKWVDKE